MFFYYCKNTCFGGKRALSPNGTGTSDIGTGTGTLGPGPGHGTLGPELGHWDRDRDIGTGTSDTVTGTGPIEFSLKKLGGKKCPKKRHFIFEAKISFSTSYLSKPSETYLKRQISSRQSGCIFIQN